MLPKHAHYQAVLHPEASGVADGFRDRNSRKRRENQPGLSRRFEGVAELGRYGMSGMGASEASTIAQS